MSVFTTVSFEQMQQWLKGYDLGELLDLQGIASGITNTNYFVTTDNGRYVLTLFEEHSAEELPNFLDLMTHLAERGIPCPHPVKNNAGRALGELNGKPAALVSCLAGRSLDNPMPQHCAAIGEVLARMHIAGASFKAGMSNLRGQEWRIATAAKVAPFLDEENHRMLDAQLEFERTFDTRRLPRGVIHADLFRDNVLMDGDKVGGVIDFYYACHDALLYDIAIAVNDWCVNADCTLDAVRVRAFLDAYHAIRPLTGEEHAAWPGMLRVAAMRFWLSRLNDLYFPQAGELTHAKDPAYFERILKHSIAAREQILAVWVNAH
ncbi:homoserine kinase [Methylobacillus flagellatus]|uniref:Homoserine kinase n=1 Tax=Methylobacillus flagellatus (strain ATCC 51484 / DSM 6875 / VKM B-1610 / KT) TaxID=265072 RepID=KHSE_METFK|nr:homoserine kinase [Methylobacillus flagellatus]Q9RAM6.2 RecName: Full=Homoserine kinase; Short=HK; Short=HSK [Methylobacillus flagellatus KT]ABE48632.1 homoserine kinase [Methylobacillus flagellatus KT]